MLKNRPSRIFALFGALTLSLAACSSNSASDTSSDSGKIQVAASFYPIKWLTENIGGDAVEVTSVTPTNVEPHDYELSPKQIADLNKKKFLFYVKGFQPSLDEAATSLSATEVVDLSSSANLVHHEGVSAHDHDEGTDSHSHEHSEADHTHDADHAESEASAHSTEEASHTPEATHTHSEGENAHDEDALDPHFWLDPARMISTGEAITKQLSKADPNNAELYSKNFTALKEKLTSLDSSYSDGLKKCERSTIITTHASFGYMTERYNLKQLALSGIDPDAEPSPAVLAQIKEFITQNGTTTIFTEKLVSPKTAQALAQEAGASTDVLDPLESQPESGDYLKSMEANLTALKKALSCA